MHYTTGGTGGNSFFSVDRKWVEKLGCAHGVVFDNIGCSVHVLELAKA